jgi:hypothetical protein
VRRDFFAKLHPRARIMRDALAPLIAAVGGCVRACADSESPANLLQARLYYLRQRRKFLPVIRSLPVSPATARHDSRAPGHCPSAFCFDRSIDRSRNARGVDDASARRERVPFFFLASASRALLISVYRRTQWWKRFASSPRPPHRQINRTRDRLRFVRRRPLPGRC